MEKILKEDSALSNAYKALETAAYSSEQLLEYERYTWKEEEIQTRIDDARLAGKEQGRAEGRAEERAKAEKELAKQKAKAEKITIARKFLTIWLTASQISETTGISIGEIQSL